MNEIYVILMEIVCLRWLWMTTVEDGFDRNGMKSIVADNLHLNSFNFYDLHVVIQYETTVLITIYEW